MTTKPNRDSNGRFVKKVIKPPFEVGERVTRKDDGTSHVPHGTIGTVNQTNARGEVFIKWDNGFGDGEGDRYSFKATASMLAKAAPRPFHVGDRVRSICGLYTIQGMVGEIREVRGDGCCFVHFGDSKDWEPGRSHWPDQMELVEPAPQSKDEEDDLGLTVIDTDALAAKDAEITTLKAEVERLTKERNTFSVASDLMEASRDWFKGALDETTRRAEAAEAKLDDIRAIMKVDELSIVAGRDFAAFGCYRTGLILAVLDR